MNLEEITEYMDQLKDQEARLKFELKNTEKEIEKYEKKLQDILREADVESMDFGIYTFGWTKRSRKAFNQKLFGEIHPDLYEKFKVETETEKFEFKINK